MCLSYCSIDYRLFRVRDPTLLHGQRYAIGTADNSSSIAIPNDKETPESIVVMQASCYCWCHIFGTSGSWLCQTKGCSQGARRPDDKKRGAEYAALYMPEDLITQCE